MKTAERYITRSRYCVLYKRIPYIFGVDAKLIIADPDSMVRVADKLSTKYCRSSEKRHSFLLYVTKALRYFFENHNGFFAYPDVVETTIDEETSSLYSVKFLWKRRLREKFRNDGLYHYIHIEIELVNGRVFVDIQPDKKVARRKGAEEIIEKSWFGLEDDLILSGVVDGD